MSCKGSGYTFTDHAINWVRQAPGKGLVYIGWTNTNTGVPTYVDSFKGKVTMTLDKTISTAFLQASGLKAEDTAVYYCARDTVKETSVRVIQKGEVDLLLVCGNICYYTNKRRHYFTAAFHTLAFLVSTCAGISQVS